jgi:hypothetical protein
LDFAESDNLNSDDSDSETENLNVDTDPTALALVLLYGPPNVRLLSESFNTLWACERGGPADYQVVSVSSINALVSMQPLPRQPGDPENLWFAIEKSGLEDIPVNVDTVVDE